MLITAWRFRRHNSSRWAQSWNNHLILTSNNCRKSLLILSRFSMSPFTLNCCNEYRAVRSWCMLLLITQLNLETKGNQSERYFSLQQVFSEQVRKEGGNCNCWISDFRVNSIFLCMSNFHQQLIEFMQHSTFPTELGQLFSKLAKYLLLWFGFNLHLY